ADDSAHSRVKVGHRQASIPSNTPSTPTSAGGLVFWGIQIQSSSVSMWSDLLRRNTLTQEMLAEMAVLRIH
ncbi:MAG: hypothetical protein AB9M53_08115, partial [Leptothrix sp. (in: b-proteobacteria)]